MRVLFGIVLIGVGLFWTLPGVTLAWLLFHNEPQVTQTGPTTFEMVEVEITEVGILGKSFSPVVACAIDLITGTILAMLGLFLLCSNPHAGSGSG